MKKILLGVLFVCGLAAAGNVIFVPSSSVEEDTNRSVSFPGGSGSGAGNSDEHIKVVTGNFHTSNICNQTADTCTFYMRAKVSSYPSGNWMHFMGSSDGAWGRGIGLTQRDAYMYFWVGQWNGNFVEVARPSAGTWFNAVARAEKSGGGVQLCVNGTDGTPDTLSTDITDTASMPFSIGDVLAPDFGKQFQGVIDEVAVWSTYMDDTSKGTLCASGYKGNPADVYASPTVHYRITSSDTIATDGIADSGSLNLDGDADDELSISTDVAP